MNGLTNYITELSWEETITRWYVLIDDAYQLGLKHKRIAARWSGPVPAVSDSEIITLGVVIETYFQGHEELGYAFIQQYLRGLFPRLLDLDRFNVRRRGLVSEVEVIRQSLRDQKLDPKAEVRVVDSLPIELMTYTRGSRSKSAIGQDYFGRVTSKDAKIFGLRLHATVTEQFLVDDWLLAPACVHDSQVVDPLVADRKALVLIGD